ncbi:unnamed protein product [Lymnaea stagnalis]|uniref:Espin n=1 Tax=Lymnaea stagnalis TaxID=6523 RepID=A0AAV2HBH2_LYMST
MVALNALEACKIGDIETLKKIQSVSPAIVDSNGASCLHYAARGGSVAVVEYLVKNLGFSPLQRSYTGATPLHDAAAKGNTAIIKWLLENTELQVDEKDSSAVTALHLAARYRHLLSVEWLLDEAHANAGARAQNDALPLHFAVVGGNMNCVKILVDENPRLINMQMNNGTTSVYLACQAGYLDILKYLVSRNGATKIKAYDAMSCLHAAAQMGHLDIVKWLIKDEKCNPNDRDFEGATPLHYAASRGHAKIVEWMLKDGGAKITLDNLGGSPLHNAVELGEVKTVVTLLKAGCDVILVDNEGLTAADLADKCNEKELAALIRGEITADQLSHVPHSSSAEKIHRIHHLRSPHLNFPPPPPFPPEDSGAVTTTASTNTRFGATSPPLPPPPLPLSPPTSTPSTIGSPISPPTPINEEDQETITSLVSSPPSNNRDTGTNTARETFHRSPSRVSVDSTASNFGVFEQQQGAIIHIVKADVHNTPSSRPGSYISLISTGSHNTTQDTILSTASSNSSLSQQPESHQSNHRSNIRSLNRVSLIGEKSPRVVNIYSKQGKSASAQPTQQQASSAESLASKSAPIQNHISNTAVSAKVSSEIVNTVKARNTEDESVAKIRRPHYSTQYRQDFNTGTKTSFAKVKALFQEGGAVKQTHICPDSGEICTTDEQQLYTSKQSKAPLSKMDSEASTMPPPPPPLPSDVEKTNLPQNGTNGSLADSSKSVVNIHGGHVTIISTGSKSGDVDDVDNISRNGPRPLSGGPELTTQGKSRPLQSPSPSDNVSAMMKELRMRRNSGQLQESPAPAPVANGRGEGSSVSHQKMPSMVRPASVATSLDINGTKDLDGIKSPRGYSRSSSSSSISSQPRSPGENKHDLIADIQSAVSGSSNLSLRRAKSRGEGVSMVYQSKKGGTTSVEAKNDHRPLTGQFDPKNFLDQIEKVDSTGLVIPEWRRQVLAKHAAEKAQKEFEEKKIAEDYEERFKNMPAWKRAVIERKEAQVREEAEAAKK